MGGDSVGSTSSTVCVRAAVGFAFAEAQEVRLLLATCRGDAWCAARGGELDAGAPGTACHSVVEQ